MPANDIPFLFNIHLYMIWHYNKSNYNLVSDLVVGSDVDMKVLNFPQVAEGSEGSKKYNSYPLEYKIMIIEEAKRSNNSLVSRTHGIDKKSIRHWRRDELKIRAALESGRNFRLAGGGRKYPRP